MLDYQPEGLGHVGTGTVGWADVGVLVDLPPARAAHRRGVRLRDDPRHERRAALHVHGRARAARERRADGAPSGDPRAARGDQAAQGDAMTAPSSGPPPWRTLLVVAVGVAAGDEHPDSAIAAERGITDRSEEGRGGKESRS